MRKLKANKTASQGVVIGRAHVYTPASLVPSQAPVAPDGMAAEKERYQAAVARVCAALQPLAETSDIFSGHLEIAGDIALREGVSEGIDGGKNAEAALMETAGALADFFVAEGNDYMRERAADIRDVAGRILAALQSIETTGPGGLTEPAILVACDLLPSETAGLDLNLVQAILTQEGGVTSHVSIMARTQGIPAIVGLRGLLEAVRTGDTLCVDAGTGDVVVDPDEETLEEFRARQQAHRRRLDALKALAELPAETPDGRSVRLCANVGNVEETKTAAALGVDGVGLFRTEFLYMENSRFPTEEEQYAVYRAAAAACPQELTIRTLDIGGDKGLSYYPFEPEENPFLGWRALRISLELREVFKTQLRAILRAGTTGHIRVMFPMIISLEELQEAKETLHECARELREEGVPYGENIEVGIMVETPASVLLIDALAREVDFVSIGTNDLTQYILAVDRGNQRIAALYNALNPAVLRSIARVIEAAHDAGIPAGMCGELAGDATATGLLLGLGLDEFSMAASLTPEVKAVVLQTRLDEAQRLARAALNCITVAEVEAALRGKPSRV